jgi:hypothetical protein
MREGGYAVISTPEGGLREFSSFTCAHCQRIVLLQARASAAESGGWCGVEGKPICGPCASDGTCRPWEKQFEKIEARDRFLRSAGLA